jgi:hypothetical protein
LGTPDGTVESLHQFLGGLQLFMDRAAMRIARGADVKSDLRAIQLWKVEIFQRVTDIISSLTATTSPTAFNQKAEKRWPTGTLEYFRPGRVLS